MRYTTASYGEHATLFGEFSTGRGQIDISLWKGSDGSVVTLTSIVCDEIGTTGVFRWRTSDIDPGEQPDDFTEYLYIMSDNTPVVGTGRTQKGMVIIGGFPSYIAAGRFDGFVHINTDTGVAGQDYDIGLERNPSDNETDALAIAVREKFQKYHVHGPLTITVPHENWLFEGVNPDEDIITVSPGVSVAGSSFIKTGIRGDLTGSIACEKCIIGAVAGTVTGLNGTFTECGFDGTIVPAPFPGKIQGLTLASLASGIIPPYDTCTLDFDNELCVVIGLFSGLWKIININDAGTVVAFGLEQAILTLDASIDGGNWVLVGVGELVDNKAGAATFLDYIIRGSRIDVATGTRATQAQILNDATPFPGTFIDAAISSINTAVGALNDLSIADVQTALTNQGYTTVRAPNLDNLDALVSSRAVAGDNMGLTPAAIAAVADAVLAEPVGDHEGTADSLAAVIRRISHHTVGRAKFNTTDDAQWRLEVYEDDDRTTVAETFDLKRLDGTVINDANPDPLVDDMIADTDPV